MKLWSIHHTFCMPCLMGTESAVSGSQSGLKQFCERSFGLLFVCVEVLSSNSCLPGLNQYLAEDRVSYSRTQDSASSESQTRNPWIPSVTFYQQSHSVGTTCTLFALIWSQSRTILCWTRNFIFGYILLSLIYDNATPLPSNPL